MPKPTFPDTDAGRFAARLWQAMDDAGWPDRGREARLRKMFKVSQPTAHAWIKGDHKPDTDRVRRIAEELLVRFDWLYFAKPAKYAPPRGFNVPMAIGVAEGDPNGLSADERELLLNYRACDESTKRAIAGAARAGRESP